MKDRVCTSCGYIGKPINQCLGSFIVDAFIWLSVSSIAFTTGLIPLLIIPLAWTIYHLAKFRTTKCPKCECLDMVSIDSTNGKAVLEHQHGRPKPWSDAGELELPSLK